MLELSLAVGTYCNRPVRQSSPTRRRVDPLARCALGMSQAAPEVGRVEQSEFTPMNRFGVAISRLIDVFTNIAGAFIVLMMLHISLDVFLRYVLHTSIGGTIEIVSNYYMIIIGFLSLCFTEEKNRQIAVELFTAQMPLWVQKHLSALALLVSGTVFTLLLIRSFQEAMAKYHIGASVIQGTSEIIIWPAFFVVPFGCFLVLLVIGYKLACYVTGAQSSLDDKIEQETF